jgi:pimeloyl-ACP methyl ester carboxylesterase
MWSARRFFSQRFKVIPKVHVARDDNNGKPPLVFLPGLAASSLTWEPVLAQLDTAPWRVIVLDLLGFGNSPKPDYLDYTVDQHLAAVRKTLKSLGASRNIHLVGHSLGSIISARYCHKFPQVIEKAILVSLPLYFSGNEKRDPITKVVNDAYMKSYNYFRSNPKFTIRGSQAIRKLFKIKDGINVTEENWLPFKHSLVNAIENQDTLADIVLSNIPITEIHGSLDEVIVTGNINMLKKIRGVKMIKVSGESHEITPRFGKKISQTITDFFL